MSESRLNLIEKVVSLPEEEMTEHLRSCKDCAHEFMKAYLTYKTGSKEKSLDSFPPFKKDIEPKQFLNNWKLKISHKREKAEYSFETLTEEKMKSRDFQILLMNLISEMIKVLDDAPKKRPYSSLIGIFSILENELTNPEFEILTGFEREELFQKLGVKSLNKKSP